MKKNVLVLSISAALLGLTGGAHAMTGLLKGAGSVPAAAKDAAGAAVAASTLRLNGDGVGQMLLVPYFNTQGTNATLINITNTDLVRGKAVKVRFRGASNSDDLFDFQVFLSPGDVWSANVSKGADGRSILTTTDSTCTKPAKATLNSTPFVIGRLDTTLTADQKAVGTREGYVEIFNMGDIPPLAAAVAGTTLVDDVTAFKAGINTTAGATDNPLYTVIKHAAATKTPPCTGTAWTKLDTVNMEWDAAVAQTYTPAALGMLPPTTGLMANWTIINVASAGAWTGEAVAVQNTLTAAPFSATTGNVVYWPQTGEVVNQAAPAVSPRSTVNDTNFFTADPLLRKTFVAKWDGAAYVATATPAVTAGYYDLPDFSTPYGTAVAANDGKAPLAQATTITNSIAASSVINEYLTDKSITASTDWSFSQPTRRYSVAFNYGATIAATDDGRRFADIVTQDGTFANGFYLAGNTNVAQSAATANNGRQVCTTGISASPYDREETGVVTSVNVVVSPSTPADPLSFCGEATILSVNNGGIKAAGTGALGALVAVKDIDATFPDGWLKLGTPAASFGGTMAVNGLPMVGAAYQRAFAGTQSFGATFKHRMGR